MNLVRLISWFRFRQLIGPALIATTALLTPEYVSGASPVATDQTETVSAKDSDDQQHIKKILFIGDSMTGWLSERLNAYGNKNGFEVATVVWDGSTIQKWGNSPRLATIIRQQNPDAVMLCLGMNELFEKNPETRLKSAFTKIIDAIGDRPLLWIGPPSWPGHSEGKVLNDWLERQLGEDSFFNSSELNLERQSKTNPHPSKTGIIKWMDSVADWIPLHSRLDFESLDNPGPSQMSRGKYFIYKRMKETL